NGMGENSWLLIKHDDEFSTKKDITKLDTSVLSGKTIKMMEKNSDAVWQSGREDRIEKKEEIEEKKDIEIKIILKEAPKSAIFKGIKPMLATWVDQPFDDPDWQYEVKWDGYRALAFINKGEVELLSRNNKSFDDKFYPIHQLLKELKINAVIDGEILVLDEKGISNFGTLQNCRSEADGELVFYVFDILWHEGKDLTELTLVERQAILNEVLPTDDDRLRISRVFDTSGIDFFSAAERMGLEGIMAKRKSST